MTAQPIPLYCAWLRLAHGPWTCIATLPTRLGCHDALTPWVVGRDVEVARMVLQAGQRPHTKGIQR